MLHRGESATVVVDLENVVGTIDPKIYGHFIEHLGRCIYGGIWVKNSFDNRVTDLIKGLRPPLLRWPGGNFASGYHWMDGVGPAVQRPAKLDLAWKAVDLNSFGTDEFMSLCRLVQSEPYICVNTGSGTAEEAANWVEYCNRPGGSHYADLRAKNGNESPFPVKLWGLGNETYGDWQIGHCDAHTYGVQAAEFSKRMKWVDPSINTIAVGCDDPQWNWEVLRVAHTYIDYMSLHKYYYNSDYYERVAAPLEAEKSLRRLASTILAVTGEPRIKVAFDEWNLWHPQANDQSGYFQSPVLTDAIFAAGMFNVLHRLCEEVRIACLAQLVNVLPIIVSDEKGVRPTPPYFVFQLYRNHAGPKGLRVQTKCDTYTSKAWGEMRVPFIDVSATLDKEKHNMAIFIVNRDKEEERECEIRIRGWTERSRAELHELGGRDVEMEEVSVVRKDDLTVSERFDYTAPPHSLSVIKARMVAV